MSETIDWDDWEEDDDQQVEVIDRRYTAYGGARDLFLCNDRELLLEGGAGCVAGETLLWDPVVGEGRRIDELYRSGIRPVVDTLDGPVLAHTPFIKGVAPLYRVTAGCREILATADHLFLSAHRWVRTDSLVPGTELLLVSPEGAHRSSRKASDSPGDCPRCRRLCDPQPRLASAVAQVRPPSRFGVPGRTHADRHGGVLVGGEGRSRAYPTRDLPSTPDYWIPSHSGTMVSGHCAVATADARIHAFLGRPIHGAGSCRCALPSSRSYPHEQPPSVAIRDSGNTHSRWANAHLSSVSWGDYRVERATVQSVEYVRTDVYYDLHVPGAEHYAANGYWNHNTGKTYGALRKLDWLCRKYPLHPSHPKPRFLMCRQTRRSMSESVLPAWENDVLWPGHPAFRGSTATRDTRTFYKYPKGAHVVVAGMNFPDRIMSAQYDGIFYFESHEGTLEEHLKLTTRLRNHAIPHPELPEPYCNGWMEDGRTLWTAFREGEFREYENRFYDGSPLFLEQIIRDTNPAGEFHWLNLRADDPHPADPDRTVMTRILSRHEDNPTITKDYLEQLDALVGAERDRLRDHKWVSEEGQVWETFERANNVIKGHLAKDELGQHWLHSERFEKPIRLKWFLAGVDWGYSIDPGVILVAGFDSAGRGYIVEEVHRLKKSEDWWAAEAVRLAKEYGIAYFMCDPSEPKHIDTFNDRLQSEGHSRIAKGADNSILTGVALVRDAFVLQDDGRPQLYVLENALKEQCPILKKRKHPLSLLQEIPGYVYPKEEDGKPRKDKPDPACRDDACDTLRYLSMWAWRKDLGRKDPKPEFAPGTYGDVLGWRDKLKRRPGGS